MLSLTLGKGNSIIGISKKKMSKRLVDCVCVITLNDTRGEEREVGKVRFVVRSNKGVKHSLERCRVEYNVVSSKLNVSREPSYPLSRHYVIKPYPVCQKRAIAFANSPSLSKK